MVKNPAFPPPLGSGLRKPARRREFAEVRQRVEDKLLDQKRAQAQATFEEELRQKAQIQVNEATLQAIRGRPAPQQATAE